MDSKNKNKKTRKYRRKYRIKRTTDKTIKDIIFPDSFDEFKKSKEKKIAKGLYGSIYLYNINNNKVAVKKMITNDIKDIETTSLKEIHFSNKIKGCNFVINVFKSYFTKDYTYLVMNYHKTDLSGFINNVDLNERILYFEQIMFQLVNGLNCLNSRGILHGDIKPGNILVDYELEDGKLLYEPKVYIADFGLSKQMPCNNKKRCYEPDILYTRTYRPYELLVFGEDFDMLENYHVNKYDENTDVWALGVTLLEYLTVNSNYEHTENDYEYEDENDFILELEYNVNMKRYLFKPNLPKFVIEQILRFSTFPNQKYTIINPDHLGEEFKPKGNIDVVKILSSRKYKNISENIITLLCHMLKINYEERIFINELLFLMKNELKTKTIYKTENKIMPQKSQRKTSYKIKDRYYDMLINFLFDINNLYQFPHKIFINSLDIINRYLSHYNVSKENLELFGLTCLNISQKLFDQATIFINNFVTTQSEERRFTQDELFLMEKDIIEKLGGVLSTCDLDDIFYYLDNKTTYNVSKIKIETLLSSEYYQKLSYDLILDLLENY